MAGKVAGEAFLQSCSAKYGRLLSAYIAQITERNLSLYQMFVRDVVIKVGLKEVGHQKAEKLKQLPQRWWYLEYQRGLVRISQRKSENWEKKKEKPYRRHNRKFINLYVQLPNV